ncbi:MAG: hypothetical protein IMX03_00855 [Brockia lithotrophica]|nr:hypothetical protein [Brockia lithotrophica]
MDEKRELIILFVFLMSLFVLVVVPGGYLIYIYQREKFILYAYAMPLIILLGMLGGYLVYNHRKIKHLPIVMGLLGGIGVFSATLPIPVLGFNEPITWDTMKPSLFASAFMFAWMYSVTQGILALIVKKNLKTLLSKYGVDTACYLDPWGKPEETRYKAILAVGKYSNVIEGKEFTIADVYDRPRMIEVTLRDNELFRMFREVAVIPKKLHYSTYPRMLEGFVVVGVIGEGQKIDERIIEEVENWW